MKSKSEVVRLREPDNNKIVKETKVLSKKEQFENIVEEIGANLEVFFDMDGLSLQI